MASAGFGEHLRREREMRGVSLDEIAGATRISTRFLEALEKEAWDRLPGGVFNRGFVRTVARFLGLEEESLLAEYSLAIHAPSNGATAFPVGQAKQGPATSAARRSAPWIALSAVAVLALAVGGWYGWRWLSARQAELAAAASVLPASPVPPAAPSTLWAAPENSAVPDAASGQDTSPWAGLTVQAATGPSTATPSGLQLKVDAVKDTAVTITSDGQQIFSGNLSAGESHSFSADNSLTVAAQDAGAVRMELNGQPLQPLAPAGQPGRMTFSSKPSFDHSNPTPNPGGRN